MRSAHRARPRHAHRARRSSRNAAGAGIDEVALRAGRRAAPRAAATRMASTAAWTWPRCSGCPTSSRMPREEVDGRHRRRSCWPWSRRRWRSSTTRGARRAQRLADGAAARARRRGATPSPASPPARPERLVRPARAAAALRARARGRRRRWTSSASRRRSRSSPTGWTSRGARPVPQPHHRLPRDARPPRDGEPVGKRLGFLLQELLREANTTGSKAADAAILQDVIGDQGRARADPRAGREPRMSAVSGHSVRAVAGPGRPRSPASCWSGGTIWVILCRVPRGRRAPARWTGATTTFSRRDGVRARSGTPGHLPSGPRCTASCTARCAARWSGCWRRGGTVSWTSTCRGRGSLPRRFPRRCWSSCCHRRREVLLERLTGRGSEDRERLLVRLRNARAEIREVGRYQYVVVNDDLERAIERVGAVIDAEGVRHDRVHALEDQVRRADRAARSRKSPVFNEATSHASLHPGRSLPERGQQVSQRAHCGEVRARAQRVSRASARPRRRSSPRGRSRSWPTGTIDYRVMPRKRPTG